MIESNSTALLRPHEASAFKKFLKIVGVVSVLWLVWSLITYHDPVQQTAPAPAQAQAQAQAVIIDPQILAIADRVGINHDSLAKANPLLQRPANTGYCSNVSLSCFVNSNGQYTLYLYPEVLAQPVSVQNTALAHEYLHYIYASTSASNRQILDHNDWLEYQTYQYLWDQRLQPYYASGVKIGDPTFYNELHSIMGTEVQDSELQPVQLQWYKQWLPNRDALPSLL